MKSLVQRGATTPTIHNLNPLSETLKSVKKKKEKQSPLRNRNIVISKKHALSFLVSY